MILQRHLPRVQRWIVASAVLLAAGAAQAGLFDDEEARKAILDLRARIQASDDASRARLAEAVAAAALANAQSNAQMLEQIGQLRRSLLDLNGQLETQRADNAKLRGAQEQFLRDLSELQRKQKDTVQAVEDRVRKLEPVKVTLDGKEFMAEPEEKRVHDQAMATLRAGEFDKASAALSSFLTRFAGSGYSESARFWLGNALYGKKDYKEAIATFRALVVSAPESPRAPEALLALANCQIEMKDNRGARKTLDELVKSYPASEAAAAGKERLTSVKG